MIPAAARQAPAGVPGLADADITQIAAFDGWFVVLFGPIRRRSLIGGLVALAVGSGGGDYRVRVTMDRQAAARLVFDVTVADTAGHWAAGTLMCWPPRGCSPGARPPPARQRRGMSPRLSVFR